MRRVSKLWKLLKVASYRDALRTHRVAAAVEHASVLGQLDFSFVVDVGANRGQFTLFALRTFPHAQIVSLEPLSAPAARFCELFADEERVTLFRVALGSDSGAHTMHVSAHDDSSSLLPITSVQTQLFRGTGEVRTETITVRRLSEVLDVKSIVEPALLKLDVQGFELQALRGCGDLLQCFTYVCAEGSFIELYEGQALAPEVIEYMRDCGFSLVCIYGTVSDALGRAVQADMLFKRG